MLESHSDHIVVKEEISFLDLIHSGIIKCVELPSHQHH